MEIKVYPKKQHHNYQNKMDTITTVVRKSPKFSVTKPVDSEHSTKEKVISNQAGVYKGQLKYLNYVVVMKEA